MKKSIISSIRLTLVCIVVFCVVYPALIWTIAQVSPAKGNGEKLELNGKTIGYKLEGQSFTADNYFNGRPSAVDYNAMGSGGSNKSPSNPAYLQQVANRIDSFLIHNPSVKRAQIPSELVTASGSGLDPDISPKAAYIQVARIAAIRNLKKEQLDALVKSHIQLPIAGSIGMPKLNVLQLNIDLDKLQ